jgi:uncharacterized protein (DUF2237 family)
MKQFLKAGISFLFLILFSYLIFNYLHLEEQLKKKNVLGENLQLCCKEPLTGFYRDGFCKTGQSDLGTHIVCAVMTDEFLTYSFNQGNDLITPLPNGRFPGLKAGDKWCLCISRWMEAERVGLAPPVILESTHENALDYLELSLLEKYKFSIQTD